MQSAPPNVVETYQAQSEVVKDLNSTERGAGGFGSTGHA